jgi:hypothetical protein
MTTITEPHAPVSPSGHADATAATTATKTVTGALQADVDLEAYDEEQVRLMEERCILVDDQDVAYGEGSKKRCESGVSAFRSGVAFGVVV